MAFTPGDLKRYRAENHPSADGTTSGGGLPGSPVAIVDAALGYIPTTPIPALTDPDLNWYYKEILRNENGTSDTLPAPSFFVRNGLLKPTSTGVFSLVSSAGVTDVVRLTFINSSGSVWDTTEVTLNGDTPVISLKGVEANSHVYAEVISGLGGTALANASANIFISRGTTLGLIPQSFSVADSLHQIAIDDAKNSTSSTPTRTAAPTTGVGTFTEAFSVSSALVIPGTLDLDPTHFIGIWWRIIRPDGMPAPIEKFQPILRVRTFL